MHRQFKSVLQLLALIFLLAACSSSSGAPGSPDTPNPSPPPEGPTAQLDCEREGYPCSLADVPEPILQATTEALQGAFEARRTGDMTAARAYLEARPDIVEVVGDETALRFRLEGGTPAWFVDRSGLTLSSTTATSTRPISVEALSTPSAISPQAVVGEDLTGDGKVNNRDPKRACSSQSGSPKR